MFVELLRRPLSKKSIDEVVQLVLINPEQFDVLFELIFHSDSIVAWRAAWACSKVSDKNPLFFSEIHIIRLITYTLNLNHGGVLRGILYILHQLPMPANIPVLYINACFEWMISPRFPVAVQALAMKLLYKICLKEPDFIPELRATLDNIDYQSYSPGFISTRKNIIKALNSKSIQ